MAPRRAARDRLGRFRKSVPSRRPQTLYNTAEADAYRAFLSRMREEEPSYKIAGGQRGFRRLMKERGWAVPHHYRKQKRTAEQSERERRFIEEGLGRQGAYTKHRYPEAETANEEA